MNIDECKKLISQTFWNDTAIPLDWKREENWIYNKIQSQGKKCFFFEYHKDIYPKIMIIEGKLSDNEITSRIYGHFTQPTVTQQTLFIKYCFKYVKYMDLISVGIEQWIKNYEKDLDVNLSEKVVNIFEASSSGVDAFDAMQRCLDIFKKGSRFNTPTEILCQYLFKYIQKDFNFEEIVKEFAAKDHHFLTQYVWNNALIYIINYLGQKYTMLVIRKN